MIAVNLFSSINLLNLSIHEKETNYFNNKLNNGILPTADFDVDKRVINLGEDVHFSYTGIEGDSPMTYIWDFGDATSKSNEKNPTHYYDECGFFTVNLTVIDGDGDNDTEVKEDYIEVDLIPLIASFEADLTIIDAGDFIQFQFTGLSPYPPTEFKWNFGDGHISNSENPKHQYFLAGKFTVRLTVTETSLNRSDTVTKANYIEVIAWEDNREGPTFPGYNLLILIGVASLISVIITVKLIKNRIS